MNKNILIRIANIANELDNNDYIKEANTITQLMVRLSQDFTSDPADYTPQGLDKSPLNNQPTSEGFEWTYNVPGVPNGTLKPKGWVKWHTDQRIGDAIKKQIGTPAFQNNPRTGQPAPSGQEWSPREFLQPAGTGQQYVTNQIKTRAPLYGTPEPGGGGVAQQAQQQAQQQGQQGATTQGSAPTFDYLGYAFDATRRLFAQGNNLTPEIKNRIMYEVSGLMKNKGYNDNQIQNMKLQIQSRIFNQKAFGGSG